jgi:tRNA/rRNA methyltransferase
MLDREDGIAEAGLTEADRDGLRVVLVRSRNPLNIGAAARAMTNFGFGHLRVVEPYDAGFRAARSAVDAEPVLQSAEECASVAAAVADCSLVVGTAEGTGRTAEFARLQEVAAEMVEALRGGAKVAVLFGSEKTGLSNEALSHCQRVMRIPTEPDQPSMNLGQAVAVVLYELVRERGPWAAPEAATMASAGDRERLVALLTEMLERSTGDREASGPTAEEKVRRLIRPMVLTEEEAHGWMGVVRHVLWKLRGGTKSC